MGYREDIALTVSAPGWSKFLACKAAMPTAKSEEIDTLLSDADEHWENPDGDQLFTWESIKAGCDDFQSMMKVLQSDVESVDWYMISIGEDGTEEYLGEWHDNPFGLCTTRQFVYNTNGCLLNAPVPSVKAPGNSNKKAWNITIPASGPPVNDHTCTQCGNTACNKTEKSCWKCGCPISSSQPRSSST